jgi:hypothetical protein
MDLRHLMRWQPSLALRLSKLYRASGRGGTLYSYMKESGRIS